VGGVSPHRRQVGEGDELAATGQAAGVPFVSEANVTLRVIRIISADGIEYTFSFFIESEEAEQLDDVELIPAPQSCSCVERESRQI
jgi:hypothetical protein